DLGHRPPGPSALRAAPRRLLSSSGRHRISLLYIYLCVIYQRGATLTRSWARGPVSAAEPAYDGGRPQRAPRPPSAPGPTQGGGEPGAGALAIRALCGPRLAVYGADGRRRGRIWRQTRGATVGKRQAQ